MKPRYSQIPLTLVAVMIVLIMTLPTVRRSTPTTSLPNSAAAPLATATDVPGLRRTLLIQGHVVEGTGPGTRPIAGARVILWAVPGRCYWSTATDADGRFVRRCFDLNDDGLVQIHVPWPSSREPWVGTFRVGDIVNDVGVADVLVSIFRPTPVPGIVPSPTTSDDLHYVSMTGHVVDGSQPGKPSIVGARVSLGEIYGGYAAHCLSPIFTDDAGDFEAWCPTANFLADVGITVKAQGFATWLGGFRGQWFSGRETIELAPIGTPSPPPATATTLPGSATSTPQPTPTDPADWIHDLAITGEVHDGEATDAAPLQGARVFAYARPGSCTVSVLTDGMGRFAHHCYDANWQGNVEIHVVAPTSTSVPRGYEAWVRRYALGAPGIGAGPIHLWASLRRVAAGASTETPDSPRFMRIFGKVVDGSRPGKPHVPFVRIEAASASMECRSPVFSQSDGQYELFCPSSSPLGFIDLQANSLGYRTWITRTWGYASEQLIDIELSPAQSPTPSPFVPPSATPTATLIPPVTSTPTNSPVPPTPPPPSPIPGDIGWQKLRGTILDGRTQPRQPLAGAIVRCSQFSYNPRRGSCSPGEISTGPNGVFRFDVFIHDTDKITIDARKPGYRAAEERFQGFACVAGCPTSDLLLEWMGWRALLPLVWRSGSTVNQGDR